MADEKKKDNEQSSWGRDLAFFTGGVIVGTAGTVIAGHLSNGKVPVPDAMKAALGPQQEKPKQ